MVVIGSQKRVGAWVAGMLLALVVAAIIIGWFIESATMGYLISIGVLIIFLVILGKAITGRAIGVLINPRNLMSLSRFQIVIWTVIVLSAYLVMALHRLRVAVDDPCVIEVPGQIWALLGISTASLVGTPLISNSKKKKEPADPKISEQTAKFFAGETKDSVDKNREGILYANENTADARFSDMFEGDELKDTAYVDLAKVQMFFFTVIVAVSYAVVLFQWMQDGENPLGQFPGLSDGMVALMGISHAGYLGNKAVDHTKTA